MNFEDTSTDSENRFSVGIETESGQYYLSIPVANRMVDYEEHYLITKEQYDRFSENRAELVAFAENCRKRLYDHLLLQKPGRDRGLA